MDSTVQLEEDYHINVIGAFIVQENLLECTNTLRLVSLDHRQSDGTFLAHVPGIGTFPFVYKKKSFLFVRTARGAPVTSRLNTTNTTVHEDVSIKGPGSTEIKEFCNDAIKSIDSDVDDKLKTFIWDANSEFWKRDSMTPPRTFDSVVLDKSVKESLLQDLDDFVSSTTGEWYKKHGIPFRRGYLLYGPPGTGKTSTIVAIASKLNRKIYRINLVAPRLCDNSLLMAMNEAKPGSLIVMEDIDSLFGKFRDKTEDFVVTFSGLLNAIDGISDTTRGMIFVFTSNHPERLDPAIRRKGRIDLEIRLGYCTADQYTQMFLKFYPEHVDEAQQFTKNMLKVTSKATPAQLQHHFITMRRKSAKDAMVVDPDLFAMPDDCNMWL